jgi:hypothetical protein
MKNFSILLSISLLAFACTKKQPNSWSVTSPDKSIKATINLDEKTGKLSYFVLNGADTVINPSSLGLIRNDQSFADGLSFSSVDSVKTIDEAYTMFTGKRKENRNYANELGITFSTKQKSMLKLLFRAYDKGIAFKYEFPETNETVFTITGETTSFSVPNSGKAYLQPYDRASYWAPAYEQPFSYGSPIGEASADTNGWCFPALFNSKNWLLISEADLKPNYVGSHLNQNCENGNYSIRFPEKGEALGLYNNTPSSTLPWSMPWRFVIIGKNLGDIVESNMVHHLATPQVAGDFNWVKPGRASWSWWGEHDSPKDFKRLKAYIDFAKSVKWEYCLIDANWDLMKNGGTIEDLCKYANSQGVPLALWYNSGGPHNNVTERPRDIMNDPIKRKEEFKKIASWGVKAVKIDFFQSDKQEIMKEYWDILKDAAEAQILVVFHGCTIPRGWSRTYPNLVSLEAIWGAEQYGWSNFFAKNASRHNTVVAVTRNVIGPMDYTPMTFSDYDCCKHQTSNAHELALSVIFESGIMHWADRVDSYKAQSDKVKELMSVMPVTWDETKFVDGEPAKLTIIARQKGENWFVGGINGDSISKELAVNLPFIATGDYKLTLYIDGKDSRTIEVKDSNYQSGQPISIKMLPKGGFTAWIRK